MAVRSYGLYVFDLDGTLFRGESPIPGAAETLAKLRASGSKVRFLTNNSGQTRDTYVEKLSRLGFDAGASEVFSSAVGTVRRLQEDQIRRAFVIGEPGLHRSLQDAGIEIVSHDAQAVVVGICKSINYALLDDALQLLLSGAMFYATNTDATYPIENGKVVPGAGVMVAAVQTSAGRPPVIIGKPEPYLVELVMSEAGVDPKDTLVVGDRYETDIIAGQRAGCDTLLVMTGVSSLAPSGQWSLPSVVDLVAQG